ncbi:MAG: protein kinase [Planctomycetota bacterium]
MTLEEIVEEFLDRQRRGDTPTVGEYAVRFPDLANSIRATLPALQIVERNKSKVDLPVDDNHVDPEVPEKIGDYDIVTEIGRGGMGIVYEAEQRSLGRRVALKVVRSNVAIDTKTIARFQREARAAGKMHHTNIVTVFEVGEDDGAFFYSMQIIDGASLNRVIDAVKVLQRHESVVANNESRSLADVSDSSAEHQLAAALLCGQFAPQSLLESSNWSGPKPESSSNGKSSDSASNKPFEKSIEIGSSSEHDSHYLKAAARLGMQVAEALAYAHSRSVVHRDIKPSNLLLDCAGVIWVTDFGLAKAENDNLTQTGDIVGTLRYMSPERLHGQSDHRCDIYGLGVTLYELLTLRPAIDATSKLEVIDRLKSAEIPSPRSVRQSIPIDLETILLKAIERNPDKRYATAQELADDLRRFIADEPISARRISIYERAVRWGRKHRSLMALLLSTICFVLLIAIVSPLALLREATLRGQAEEAWNIADQRTELINRNLYFAEMNLAGQATNEPGGIGQVRDLVAHWKPTEARTQDLRGWEWYFLKSRSSREDQVLKGPTDSVWSVVFSPSGDRVASVSNEGYLTVWDQRTGECLRRFATKANTCVDWSPDGKHIAATTFHGQLFVWEADTFAEIYRSQEDTGTNRRLQSVKWSPNGKLIAFAGGNGRLIVWEMESQQQVVTLQFDGSQRMSLCWDPDGRRIALTDSYRINLVDVDDAEVIWDVEQETDQVQTICFSPDSKRIAAAGYDGKIVFRDSANGDYLNTWQVNDNAVWSIDWGPERHQFASAHADRVVRVWDVDQGRPSEELHGHTHPLYTVQWSADGRRLVSGGADLSVRVWDVDTLNRSRRFYGDSQQVSSIAWSPDGKRLASGGVTGMVKAWDLSDGTKTVTLRGETCEPFGNAAIRGLTWSRDGKSIAWGQMDGTIHIHSEAGEIEWSGHKERVYSLDWDPESKYVASCGADKQLAIWDATTGELVKSFECESEIRDVAWSPDGQWIASGEGKIAIVRSFESGEIEFQTPPQDRRLESLCWSPDGENLATAWLDLTTSVWNPKTGQQLGESIKSTGSLQSLGWRGNAMRPRLAGGSHNRTVRLWDTSSGKLILSLAVDGDSTSVRWSPDGMRLAATGGKTVYVWDATRAYEAERNE